MKSCGIDQTAASGSFFDGSIYIHAGGMRIPSGRKTDKFLESSDLSYDSDLRQHKSHISL
jgi:hypothetical protein